MLSLSHEKSWMRSGTEFSQFLGGGGFLPTLSGGGGGFLPTLSILAGDRKSFPKNSESKDN